MGREVRRVPAGWEHPRDKNGKYKPLYDGSYRAAVEKWKHGYADWESGIGRPEYSESLDEYWEYAGNPPDPEDYMFEAEPEDRTHWQMYEDTSEGTPISPVFDCPKKLARWLADTGASAFADRTATYDQWLATIDRGHALSAVIAPGTGAVVSGVEALAANEASEKARN